MADPDPASVHVSDSSGNSHSTEDKSSEIGPATNDGVNKLKLAENEHKAVVRSKVLVILTLLGAATILGFVTHQMITREETSDFESQVSTTFTRSVLLCFLVYLEATNV
jgi:hypothetical protein